MRARGQGGKESGLVNEAPSLIIVAETRSFSLNVQNGGSKREGSTSHMRRAACGRCAGEEGRLLADAINCECDYRT